MASCTIEDIRSLKRRTELLAPAGRRDVLEAVLEAGADAVYLGGKQFQMRAHRRDFHFDEAGLDEAAQLVHRHGRKIYVTMNSLLAAHELEQAREFLVLLERIGVDAVIVCDLASIALAREVGVSFELHASTMMNVHDVDQALVLKDLGISRIITSRDISIREAGRIGEGAGVAVEYFVHGDMCVAQSGHCNLSAIALGKSANRGECMKPCRWEYELINKQEGRRVASLREGHLLSIRDLALVRQLSEMIEAGICSLKIEGRMRDARYLGGLVSVYREAIDRYYQAPSDYFVPSESLEKLFRSRVRDLSTLIATGAPSGSGLFDTSGRREPLILSNGAREVSVTREAFDEPSFRPCETAAPSRRVELAVCVSSLEAARQALAAGADRLYLSAETRQIDAKDSLPELLDGVSELVAGSATQLGIRTPRVSGSRGRSEWTRLVDACRDVPVAFVLTHHLGALKRAHEGLPGAKIVADYGFNVLNPMAALVLRNLGAASFVASQEAGFEEVDIMARESVLPLEIVAHGPITAMLLEHCVIAQNLTKSGSKDMCRAPCQHSEFALRDAAGEERVIITDQYCRNHILAAKDLAILPCIDRFLPLPLAALRIEGQFYEPSLVGRLTAAYREAIDAREAGAPAAPDPDTWAALLESSPRPWNYGAYAQRVTHSASTVEVMKAVA